MVTSLLNQKPARDSGYLMVQYISGRVQANPGGAVVNVKIGTIPAGSVIISINNSVKTAFTGGTPALALGTSSGGTQIQGTMAETAGVENLVPAAALAGFLTADTDVWAGLSGGATAGDGYVTVLFIKPAV